jgi:hypothetical protein
MQNLFGMIKYLPLVIIFQILGYQMKAQKLLINIKSGYAFPLLKENQGIDTNNTFIYISNGKGIINNLNFEYLILPNLSIELENRFLLGSKQTTDEIMGISKSYSRQMSSGLNFKFYQHLRKLSLNIHTGIAFPIYTRLYRELERNGLSTYIEVHTFPNIIYSGGYEMSRYFTKKLKAGISIQYQFQNLRERSYISNGQTFNFDYKKSYTLPFSSINSLLFLSFHL